MNFLEMSDSVKTLRALRLYPKSDNTTKMDMCKVLEDIAYQKNQKCHAQKAYAILKTIEPKA